MSHLCVRTKHSAQETLERHTMPHYEKVPVLISAKDFPIHEMRHAHLHIMLALPVRRAEKRIFTFQAADHLGRIYFSPRPPLPIALGKFLQAGRIHHRIHPFRIKAHTQTVQRLTRPDCRGTKYSIETQPTAPYHLTGSGRLLHSKRRQRNLRTSSSNNVCPYIASRLPVPQKI